MTPETLPPYRRISSRSVSLADGSKMLDKYLATSQRHPHLHPGALITPSGVTYSSHGGPMGGVVMHNLRRVAAGLRGEYLEPEPEPEPELEEQGTDAEETTWRGKGKKNMRDVDVLDSTQNDWQNMSDFEREEAQIELGEVGDRATGVQDGEDAPDVVVVDGAEAAEKKRQNNQGNATLDKTARKKAKKLRAQEIKAKKEKAREGKSQKER